MDNDELRRLFHQRRYINTDRGRYVVLSASELDAIRHRDLMRWVVQIGDDWCVQESLLLPESD